MSEARPIIILVAGKASDRPCASPMLLNVVLKVISPPPLPRPTAALASRNFDHPAGPAIKVPARPVGRGRGDLVWVENPAFGG